MCRKDRVHSLCVPKRYLPRSRKGNVLCTTTSGKWCILQSIKIYPRNHTTCFVIIHFYLRGGIFKSLNYDRQNVIHANGYKMSSSADTFGEMISREIVHSSSFVIIITTNRLISEWRCRNEVDYVHTLSTPGTNTDIPEPVRLHPGGRVLLSEPHVSQVSRRGHLRQLDEQSLWEGQLFYNSCGTHKLIFTRSWGLPEHKWSV